MDRHNHIHVLLLILAVLAASCAPILPSVASLPTQQPGAVGTYVAGTRVAASTQTAYYVTPSSTPTLTGTPTRTPTVTPTATPTFIFKFNTFTPTKIPTATKISGSGGSGGSGGGGGGNNGTYDCKIISTTFKINGAVVPGPKPKIPASTPFTVTWTVKNTGSYGWDHNSVDYRYFSGTQFYLQSIYDLPKNVGAGQQVNLIVDNPTMKSPVSSGTYSAVWGLQIGDIKFCQMKITIVVP